MPIVRIDIPDWSNQEQRKQIRIAIESCIARTWFREHIWVAVRPFTTDENEKTIIMTVEVRSGRGHEKERTEALFDQSLNVFNKIIGTNAKELILLVRQFEQNDCISGGNQLPPLDDATPDINELRSEKMRVA